MSVCEYFFQAISVLHDDDFRIVRAHDGDLSDLPNDGLDDNFLSLTGHQLGLHGHKAPGFSSCFGVVLA